MSIILFCLSLSSFAAELSLEAIGDGQGAIKIERDGKVQSIFLGSSLKVGDKVSADKPLDLRFNDKSIVRLTSHASFVVGSDLPGVPGGQLLRGSARVLIPSAKGADKKTIKFQMKTRHSVMGVRGTEFFVEETETSSELFTLHGTVEFAPISNPRAIKLVNAGQKSRAAKGASAVGAPESFSVPKLQEKLDNPSGIFGSLSQRRHGLSFVSSKSPQPSLVNTPASAGEVSGSRDKKTTEDSAKGEEKGIQEATDILFLKAALELDVEMIEKLKGKVSPNTRDPNGNTAVHLAAVAKAKNNDQAVTIQQLVDLGVDINAVNHDKQTALVFAMDILDDPAQAREVAGVLINNGANLSLADRRGQTAKKIAAQKKGFGTLEQLVTPKR